MDRRQTPQCITLHDLELEVNTSVSEDSDTVKLKCLPRLRCNSQTRAPFINNASFLTHRRLHPVA